jgi:hypothetical protein
MDMGELAPDEDPTEVEAMDLGALAPDEDETEVEAMDLGALAPDDADESEAEVEAMDLGALAPDDADESEAEVEAIDLGALAPDDTDESEAEVEAIDLDALAPGEDEDEAEVIEPESIAPEGEVTKGKTMEKGEPVQTRTLAELYVKQGFVDQAVAVYRRLLVAEPGADDIRTRLTELEGGVTDSPATAQSPSRRDAEEDLEKLARDLAASGDEGHDVDTPFAWTDDTEPEPDESADIRDYFDALLSRRRSDS